MFGTFFNKSNTLIVLSGWREAGITDTVQPGKSKLPSIDTFDDIDGMILWISLLVVIP